MARRSRSADTPADASASASTTEKDIYMPYTARISEYVHSLATTAGPEVEGVEVDSATEAAPADPGTDTSDVATKVVDNTDEDVKAK